jgi:hypothetical protein
MKASVLINCPIHTAFALTNDHVTDWSSIVKEEEILNLTPDKIGSTFRTVTTEHGREMTFDGVVTAYTPPYTSGIRMEGKAFSLTADYKFEEVPEGTRVTQTSTVTGKGLFRILIPLMAFLMHKSNCQALQNELNQLKQYCEASVDSTAQ